MFLTPDHPIEERVRTVDAFASVLEKHPPIYATDLAGEEYWRMNVSQVLHKQCSTEDILGIGHYVLGGQKWYIGRTLVLTKHAIVFILAEEDV